MNSGSSIACDNVTLALPSFAAAQLTKGNAQIFFLESKNLRNTNLKNKIDNKNLLRDI